MDLDVGEHLVSVDLVEELTPQQYIQQLLTGRSKRPKTTEASFSSSHSTIYKATTTNTNLASAQGVRKMRGME